MVKLRFPKSDPRSSGEPFNADRPWLFDGAVVHHYLNSVKHSGITDIEWIFLNGQTFHPIHVALIVFEGSHGDYDMVSSEFLEQTQAIRKNWRG